MNEDPQHKKAGMALESPEALIISISKDVERLTAAVHENSVLFHANQQQLNTLIAELREHKAIDDHVHRDFKDLHIHVFGSPETPGLVTHVHDLKGKVGSMWKLIWAFLGSMATGVAGYLISTLKG